jgi:hypothetical protein
MARKDDSMRPVQNLESRIQRAAEDFGCPVLRRAALEVGEMRTEVDHWHRQCLTWHFCAHAMVVVAGFLGIWVAVLKGWI